MLRPSRWNDAVYTTDELDYANDVRQMHTQVIRAFTDRSFARPPAFFYRAELPQGIKRLHPVFSLCGHPCAAKPPCPRPWVGNFLLSSIYDRVVQRIAVGLHLHISRHVAVEGDGGRVWSVKLSCPPERKKNVWAGRACGL